MTDNELAYLESIHLFVEILDHYFSNVCELDLVFNFHKVLLSPRGVLQMPADCTSVCLIPIHLPVESSDIRTATSLCQAHSSRAGAEFRDPAVQCCVIP